MTLSLKKLLLDSNKRRGAICCNCKKPFAKYLVQDKDGVKLYCNRCICMVGYEEAK